MTENKIFTVAVVGPTASGKTNLAIGIAKKFGGEIVSADSMQIYKGMPIATACPTSEQKSEVPHHLVEFLDGSESFSVAEYVSLANKTVREIESRKALPIVAGGTGLYIDSLLNNITFTADKSNDELQKKLAEKYDTVGGNAMLEELSKIDPETASRLHANDKKRIIRAFEIYESNGLSITKQNELSKKEESPFDTLYIGITYSDREKLYERINKRVDIMLENGLLEEAANSLNKGKTAKQAIGHKELIPYLNGEISLEEAVENLKRETRRYAKRQLTWFRRNENINWIYADCEDALEAAIKIIEERVNK
jgi:tRNA dimethylallyltransferase